MDGRSPAPPTGPRPGAPHRAEVVGADSTDAQHLVDDLFVHGGVLPQIDRCEVEAERLDRAAQRGQPAVGHGLGSVLMRVRLRSRRDL